MKRKRLLAALMAGVMTVGAVGVPAMVSANEDNVSGNSEVTLYLAGAVDGTNKFIFTYPADFRDVSIKENVYSCIGDIQFSKQDGKIFENSVDLYLQYDGKLTKSNDNNVSVNYELYLGDNAEGVTGNSKIDAGGSYNFSLDDVENKVSKKLGVLVLDAPTRSGVYESSITFYVEAND